MLTCSRFFTEGIIACVASSTKFDITAKGGVMILFDSPLTCSSAHISLQGGIVACVASSINFDITINRSRGQLHVLSIAFVLYQLQGKMAPFKATERNRSCNMTLSPSDDPKRVLPPLKCSITPCSPCGLPSIQWHLSRPHSLNPEFR